MVKTRQAGRPPIVDTAWRSRRPEAEVELVALSDIAPHVPRDRVERMGFHVVVLYDRGETTHEVDFDVHRCGRGSLVYVAPSQVQRLNLHRGVEGTALLLRPSFLPAAPAGPRRRDDFHARFFEDVAFPTATRLDERGIEAARGWIEKLRRALVHDPPTALGSALVRHVVAAMLIDIVIGDGRRVVLPASSPSAELAQRFRRLAERSFRITRRVLDYAERLDCSERTLDRATLIAFGVTAKRLLDGRVVLEARRVLSHTDEPVAGIAEQLGFSEPTNFVKFFRARTGESPGSFRSRQRALFSASAPKDPP